MALPSYSMRQLLEAGVHFAIIHRRWNPKMAPYIFGIRNGIHIIDLQQTVPMLDRWHAGRARRGRGRAGACCSSAPSARRRIMWPKRPSVAASTDVNHRWLGGMLTNWKTISHSIKRLRDIEERLASGATQGLTKKEQLTLDRERIKLDRALGGIKEMGGLPDILFVIDTNKEALAVQEANVLSIPVVAILDSNSSPDGVAFPIPGNDDAQRAIHTYCNLMAGAAIDGIQAEMTRTGKDHR